ncbi:MAG: hypothetical protein AUK35_10170 [Zetaproteobacteria bacterium CG2_30_46_52]|nr:MAG: hypothetical protein AUK35_10170 [Zetaproteobacteria bacterium CG2_30_46_52]
MQYLETQEDGTEPPFKKPYWDNKAASIYMDSSLVSRFLVLLINTNLAQDDQALPNRLSQKIWLEKKIMVCLARAQKFAAERQIPTLVTYFMMSRHTLYTNSRFRT